MNEPSSDDRLFGVLAVVLLCVALLGSAWIAAVYSKEEAALSFGTVGILLALVFGIAGWRHKAAKVTVGMTGVVLILLLLGWLILTTIIVPKKLAAIRARQEARRTEMERKQAEMERRGAEQPAP